MKRITSKKALKRRNHSCVRRQWTSIECAGGCIATTPLGKMQRQATRHRAFLSCGNRFYEPTLPACLAFLQKWQTARPLPVALKTALATAGATARWVCDESVDGADALSGRWRVGDRQRRQGTGQSRYRAG